MWNWDADGGNDAAGERVSPRLLVIGDDEADRLITKRLLGRIFGDDLDLEMIADWDQAVAAVEAGSFFDPFRDEHYTAPRVVESYTQDFLTAHRESMAHSIPDLYLKGQGEYFDALREGLMMASRGEATVAEALRRTARQWRQTTRSMGRRGQIDQWNYLRSLYPERLRYHLR